MDNKTCLCKYIPLKWKEDARHTLNKPGDSARQILCKDDITPGDCNGFLVPAVEIENQKMTYFIRVNLALKCLLEKIQERLVKAHPKINLIPFGEELEYEISDNVQGEGEKSAINKSNPKKGELIHNMQFNQENKTIFLQGLGWNFPHNLRTGERYSKLKIAIGEFDDDSQLSSSVKFKTHIFETPWFDVVLLNEHGMKFMFKKDLSLMNEKVLNEEVKKRLESRKHNYYRR